MKTDNTNAWSALQEPTPGKTQEMTEGMQRVNTESKTNALSVLREPTPGKTEMTTEEMNTSEHREHDKFFERTAGLNTSDEFTYIDI